jgi:hypothetical protein
MRTLLIIALIVRCEAPAGSLVLNIADNGAAPGGKTLNTASIQKSSCATGGTSRAGFLRD